MSKASQRTLASGVAALLLGSGLSLIAAPSAQASVGDSIVNTATSQLGNGPCGSGGYYAPNTGQSSSCSNGGKAHAWCADFAGWVWAQNGVQNLGPLNDLANSFASYGTGLSSTPHVGDAVFFHPSAYSGTDYDHVAIVTAVHSDGTIDWIGGNQAGGYVTRDANMPGTVGATEWSAGGYNVNLQGFVSPSAPSTAPPVAGSTGPSVYVPDTKTTEVFKTGSDGQVYHSYYSTGSAGWTSWSVVAPGTFVGEPRAVYQADKKTEEVMALGTNGQVYHSFYTLGTGGWSGWQPIGTSSDLFTGQLQVIYHADVNTIDVAAIGTDGQVYRAYYTTGSTTGWSGWQLVAPGKFTNINMVYQADKKTIEIIGLGSNNQVYHSFYTGGSGVGWSAWQPIGSSTFTKITSVYQADINTIDAVALGTDGQVYRAYYTTGSPTGWSDWQLVSSGAFTDVNTVYHADINTIEIIALGTNKQVYHSFYTSGSGVGWSAWQPIGTSSDLFTEVYATAYEADKNTIEAFATGTDGNTYHAYYTTGSTTGWSGWARLGN